jgi:hypothetical protein
LLMIGILGVLMFRGSFFYSADLSPPSYSDSPPSKL